MKIYWLDKELYASRGSRKNVLIEKNWFQKQTIYKKIVSEKNLVCRSIPVTFCFEIFLRRDLGFEHFGTFGRGFKIVAASKRV